MVNDKCQHCGSQIFEEYSQGPDAVVFQNKEKDYSKKERHSIMRFVKNAERSKEFM